MENQVKANSARIAVLEEQNAALRNSITKVLYAQQKGPKQVQLSDSKLNVISDTTHILTSSWVFADLAVIVRFDIFKSRALTFFKSLAYEITSNSNWIVFEPSWISSERYFVERWKATGNLYNVHAFTCHVLKCCQWEAEAVTFYRLLLAPCPATGRHSVNHSIAFD